MCLTTVDKKPTGKGPGIAWKTFYRAYDGTYINIIRDGRYKSGRWYKSPRKKPIRALDGEQYIPGFHLFRRKRKEGYSISVKVAYRGVLATSRKDRQIVARWMKILAKGRSLAEHA